MECLGIIFDQDHPFKLIELMSHAKSKVLISSGWVSQSVIHAGSDLVHAMTKLLKTGVDIHLFFMGDHEEAKNAHRYAMSFLVKLKEEYPDNLHLNHQNTYWHRKLVLIDDDISVIGSYNWLSNQGDMSLENSHILKSDSVCKEFWDRYLDSEYQKAMDIHYMEYRTTMPLKENHSSNRSDQPKQSKSERQQIFLKTLREGLIIEGKVKNVQDYGLFIDIGEGVTGLLHFSKMSRDRSITPSELAKVGDTLTVNLLKVELDGDRPKIHLSILGLEKVNGFAA